MTTQPRHTQTGENLPAGEIDNRYLAKMLTEVRATGNATLAEVQKQSLAVSHLADEVGALKADVGDLKSRVSVLERKPDPPKPTRAQRLFPFFRLAALVTLTLVGTLAIVAGLLVFTSTRS